MKSLTMLQRQVTLNCSKIRLHITRSASLLTPQISRSFASLPLITNWLSDQRTTVKSPASSTRPLINPATGQHYADVCLSSNTDLDEAVQHAQHAFKSWSQLTYKARSQVLLKFRDVLLKHDDELAKLITEEHGKNQNEALGSVHKGIEVLEYACGLSNNRDAVGMMMEVSSGVVCHEYRQALGVAAAIVPFNFPIMVPLWSISLALATGNTIIVKPSEKVPQTLMRVAELAKEAGLPTGCLQILNGDAKLVEAICAHANIAAVTFVGSSKVAKLVHDACHRSSNQKRVLALGGAKNHLIALPDANREMTASDVVVSYTGCAGQRCMAASVLILVGEQQDLIDLIVSKSAALQFGQRANQIGPVIDESALKRIHSYIEAAEHDPNTKILLDGRKLTSKHLGKEFERGYWIGPTILLHSNSDNRCVREEIFGPVLSIYIAGTVDEAIAIENRSVYGNAACVYTSVGAHAQYVEKRLAAGMVGINIGVPVPREPFSFAGFNTSRYGSHESTGAGAVDFFSRKRKVTTKWVKPDKQGAGDWMS